MIIGLLIFAAAAADTTEKFTEFTKFYKNGLDQISSNFTTILINSDIEDTVADRYVEKMEKLVLRIQAKHDKLSELDGISFPVLDIGGPDLYVTENLIDLGKPCQAVDSIKNELKNWARDFVEMAVKECDGDKCFKPTEGPLKSVDTHQNWHNKNSKWIEQFSEKIDSLIKKTRIALECGKFLD